MIPRRFALTVFGPVILLAGLCGTARAQCQEWRDGFQLPEGGVSDGVRAQAVFNDGGGAKLYIGGDFTSTSTGPANRMARWDGTTWSTLGSGMNGSVNALAVFDDGSGSALYAGGSFSTAGGVPANNIARWNGTSWSALGQGTSNTVLAVAVFDDGSGPALYAAGFFTSAGGAPVNYVARWNGTSWSSLGTGLDDWGRALCVFDDGNGPGLYVGGAFDAAGGSAASRIARWNGTDWSPLGLGTNADVYAMAVFDYGAGPALYAGGDFTVAGGVSASRIAKWNGSSWSALAGGGINARIYSLYAYEDQNGPSLYAGGDLTGAGSVQARQIARWNGTAWFELDQSLDGGAVRSMIGWDDGRGRSLYAGGFFARGQPNTPAARIARWDGARWSALAPRNGTNGRIWELAVFDDGTGSALYAAGEFTILGGLFADRLARWDGHGWSAVPHGMNDTVGALLTHDDGTGLALYAGGRFTFAGGVPANRIAKWDGASWSALAGGASGIVQCMVGYDDGGGPALFVGTFNGRLEKWDGAGWSTVGIGAGPFGADLIAMTVFDDGSGPAIYAAGNFTSMNGVSANHIAKWDGTTWSPLGSGTNIGAVCMQVFDDGTGSALYVGGGFTQAGGVAADNIARWDGTSWSQVGPPPPPNWANNILSLAVFDDGTGPALYAGPRMTTVYLWRWNGATWFPVGSGPFESVEIWSLAVFDDGGTTPPNLYLGGRFTDLAESGSANIAEYLGCAGPGVPFCPGNGSIGNCPCLPNGEPGHGSENSAATGGARLDSSGTTSPDTVVLHVQGELPSALTIFLQGNVEIAPVTFGDGLRCAGGALKRLYSKSASGGAVSAPAVGDPSITARSAALGDTIPPGGVRAYQTYYRDPNPSWCPPHTFNSSSGLRILW